MVRKWIESKNSKQKKSIENSSFFTIWIYVTLSSTSPCVYIYMFFFIKLWFTAEFNWNLPVGNICHHKNDIYTHWLLAKVMMTSFELVLYPIIVSKLNWNIKKNYLITFFYKMLFQTNFYRRCFNCIALFIFSNECT